MKARTMFAAACMALLPVTGFAMCAGHLEEVAASCKDGFTWDQATSTCIEVVTG